MGKTVRLTESQLKDVIKRVISEQTNSLSEVVIGRGKLPAKGFDGNFACVVGNKEFTPMDLDSDGITDFFQKGSTSEQIRYYPNGKSKIFRGSPPNPHWEDSTWSCKNGKVIDKWLKNKSFKTYKGSPFVDDGGLRIPINTSDNGSDGKYITNLQKKLIELKLLSIPRPTGNYGKMTHYAVMTWAKDQADYTNQTRGITKDAYNRLVNFKTR